jgi:hypothetical protein
VSLRRKDRIDNFAKSILHLEVCVVPNAKGETLQLDVLDATHGNLLLESRLFFLLYLTGAFMSCGARPNTPKVA